MLGNIFAGKGKKMFNQLDKGMDKCSDTLATYDSLKIQAEM